MDFAIARETITTSRSAYSSSVQQPIDCDVTLPEYCPDILRILKCQLIPRANSSALNGDRLNIDGSAIIRILYIDETASSVHSHEQICQFSKAVDVGNISGNSMIDIDCEAEYVNCRAVNQRRVNINGAINIKININAITEKQILSSASGNGIQTKTEIVESVTIKGFAQKTITVDETLDLSRAEYPIAQLIRYSGDVALTDVRVITNKLLVKGELTIRMLYTVDDNSGRIESISHTLPVSHIIDVDGIDDTDKCKVRLKLSSLDLSLRSDSNGELRQTDVVAKISVTAFSAHNVSLQVIKEAYSIKCALETEKQNMQFLSLGDNINDVFLLRESLDVASVGVCEVIDVWVNSLASSESVESSALKLFGNVLLSMLVVDSSNQVAYLERQVEYESTYELNGCYKDSLCDIAANVSAIDYAVRGNDKIDIKIELRADVDVYKLCHKNIVVNLMPDETCKSSSAPCTLTIYFCDENESVWDIARKYNTTVDAIMRENSLDSETIAKEFMLMIPSV